MFKKQTQERRDFLKTLLAASTAPMVVSASTLGLGGAVAANDRIGLGFIAFGGRAEYLHKVFAKHPQSHFIAASDVDAGRRWNFVKKIGEGTPTYNDYRHILERNDIDAVIIATTDPWHAPAIIDAANAGKDIYCEKPLTLTIDEGKECIKAVRRAHRVFQVGSQQRSGSQFRRACELVRNGYIGKLKQIDTYIGKGPTGGMDPNVGVPPGLDWDRWLGRAPYVPYRVTRCHYEFRWWYAYSGGKLTDWGAHHNDIAQWGNGTQESGPISIEGEATFPEPGGYDTAITFDVRYEYKDAAPVICHSTGKNGIKFTGEEGEIFVSRKEILEPDDLKGVELKSDDIHLYKSENHQGNFLECVKTRNDCVCTCEIGHRSVTVCHLGNIAIRLGRKIHWDPDNEVMVGDEEAQAWTSSIEREGYRLPKAGRYSPRRRS